MYILLKEIKVNSGKLIIIGVNSTSNGFALKQASVHPDINKQYYTLFYRKNKVENYNDDVVIVDYNFDIDCKILGKISEIKEESIKQFVENFPSDKNKSGVCYKNYYNRTVITYSFNDAVGSFISLLKYQSCFIKSWVKEPTVNDYYSAQDLWDNFQDEYNDWNLLPEDLLIIYQPGIDLVHIPKAFYADIKTLLKHNFNPVAVGSMMCESTFYFNTEEEAKEAFEYFEKGNNKDNKRLVMGWWYSIDELANNIKQYKEEHNLDHKVYYI